MHLSCLNSHLGLNLHPVGGLINCGTLPGITSNSLRSLANDGIEELKPLYKDD